MTKSRKAKSKNKDFQKVKLKIGKKLPKGQNETIATFKSTSIYIKEQLRKNDDAEPTSKKRLSIKELLVHCLHYSPTFRTEGVQGILELMKSSPVVLYNNMSSIIERISSMILDKEYNVRQKAIQAMKHIFTALSVQQITPFFTLISAQITCAMTHLAEPIQQDSLDVLELCLDACPELMNATATKLLPCLVKQIAERGGKSGGQYMLITNPSSKKSSQTWRLKVLHLLQRVLNSLVEKQRINANGQVWEKCLTVDGTSRVTAPIHASSAFTAQSLSVLKFSQTSQTPLREEQDNLMAFITDITPLLSQCWIESRPTNFSAGSSLGVDKLNLVDTILAIYQLFRKCLNDNQMFEKDIAQYFLPYFPYSMQRRKGDNKKSVISPEVINLRMCNLLSASSDRSAEEPAWLSTVVAYLQRSLSMNSSQQKSFVHSAIKPLLKKWPQQSQALLEKSLECITSCTNADEAKAWMSFFTDVAFSSSDVFAESLQSVLIQWILALPQMLVRFKDESKQLVSLILSAINQAALRGIDAIRDEVAAQTSELLAARFWDPEWKIDSVLLLSLLLLNPMLETDHLPRLKVILLAHPKLCVMYLEQLSWKHTESELAAYTSLLFALLQCEEERCNFDAAVNGESSSAIHKQVARNLKTLDADMAQWKELHAFYHSKS